MHGFDEWNILKKAIETGTAAPNRFPKEGEVWVIALGRNIGFEQNGSGAAFSRPALVLKKFNNHMFLAIPLSTKQKNFDFYFNYTDPQGQPVAAILAQLRLVSIKRFERKMYGVTDEMLLRIRSRVSGWFC